MDHAGLRLLALVGLGPARKGFRALGEPPGQDLHALAERVRQTVSDRVRKITGLDTTELTVVIGDVLN